MAPRDLNGKTYWIIGASEGLGLEVATQMSRMGAHLILSARNEERLQVVAQQLGEADVLPMDVCDIGSVEAAVAAASHADGLIYCAGTYEPMTARDWRPDVAEHVAEVNFTGALRILGRTMPAWVERGAGHVVLVGSLAAYRGLPGAIGYGASKAALRHLAEDMYIDLKGTGIDVQIANPGFFDSRLTEKNDFKMRQLMTVKTAAYNVMGLVRNSEIREISYPRPFSFLFTVLSRFLPFRLYSRLISD